MDDFLGIPAKRLLGSELVNAIRMTIDKNVGDGKKTVTQNRRSVPALLPIDTNGRAKSKTSFSLRDKSNGDGQKTATSNGLGLATAINGRFSPTFGINLNLFIYSFFD